MPRAESEWSDLPYHILSPIINLLSTADYARFRAVCRSWGEACRDEIQYSPANPDCPWLMLPREYDTTSDRRYFYSLTEKRFFHLSRPQLRRRRCIACSNGWLVTADEHCELQLFNPLTGSQLDLPSITTFADVYGAVHGPDGRIAGYKVRNAGFLRPRMRSLDYMRSYYSKALVAVPFPPQVTVFVVRNKYTRVAFANAGDESWTEVDVEVQADQYNIPRYSAVLDITFHNGKLHAMLSRCGKVMVALLTASSSSSSSSVACKLSHNNSIARPIHQIFDAPSRYYLAESLDGEDLLQIWRFSGPLYEKPKFKVFKPECSDSSDEERRWVVVKNLGDSAIFIGESQSAVLSTLKFPELRRNCIYFTEVMFQGEKIDPALVTTPYDAELVTKPYDAGVFNMEDGRVEPLYDRQFSSFAGLDRSKWLPHLWFTPSM